ncbi:MAG TPA: four helix bundle protein [Thermoanaerobaculia bacterium]|nr:four helix bundle protein [Thermoanaerobaculia bacterium]
MGSCVACGDELRIGNGELRKGDDIRERAFRFACDVVNLHDLLVTRGASTRDLSRQLVRAATSVGANLEEADAGQSRADFISKCAISLKEARESHYWLRVLNATGKLPPATEPLLAECDEIIAILTTIVRKASAK